MRLPYLALLLAAFAAQAADQPLKTDLPAATAPAATGVLKPKPANEQLQRQLTPADGKTTAARNNGPAPDPGQTECDRLKDNALTWTSGDKSVKDSSVPASGSPKAESAEQRQREAARQHLGCH